MKNSHRTLFRLDILGLSASTLCAIHCALMPFIIVMLPVLGLEFVSSPVFEIVLIAISIVIGSFTLKDGFFNHHKSPLPFILFISGLGLIVLGHGVFHDHTHTHFDIDVLYFVTIPVGAIMIGLAHFLNIRMMRRCNTKHAEI